MARKQHYPIQLSDSEREELEKLVRKGHHSARIIRRAQMLLWSEQGKTDLEIAGLAKVTPLTVAETRRRWVTEQRLADAPRPGGQKKLDGKQEAFLVALACSDTPDGQEAWTMQMLADKLVELGVVEQPISDETVRRTLKKRS
jgi:DNA-binding CsgD family transcriptional regulator